MKKEKIFGILTFAFVILTFVGAGYVLINKGQANAGYAVIPMLIGLFFMNLTRMEQNKNSRDNK